jgi:hypothetical protein
VINEEDIVGQVLNGGHNAMAVLRSEHEGLKDKEV